MLSLLNIFHFRNVYCLKNGFLLQGNLKSWLLNKDCNDNYSVIYAGGQEVAIFQNKRNGPELIKSRSVSV